MQRIETTLPGVYELRPEVFRDARGLFMETYNRAEFAKLGIPETFRPGQPFSFREAYAARTALSDASLAG